MADDNPVDTATDKEPSKESAKFKRAEIKWKPAPGALRYRLQIKNTAEEMVLDREFPTNSAKLNLYEGDFLLRIGVINKFEKLSVWSEWTPVSVVFKDRVLHDYNKTLLGLGLRVGAGGNFFQVLGDWNGLYLNSLKGFDFNLAYGFKYIKAINSTFLRFTGLQLNYNYISFDGIQDIQKVDTGMTNSFLGLDVYGCTNFNFPINFIFRAGGGLAYSVLDIQKHDDVTGLPVKREELSSQDPYYKAGASVEITPYPGFFIDLGADYTTISYVDKSFSSARYFAVIGVKI